MSSTLTITIKEYAYRALLKAWLVLMVQYFTDLNFETS